MNAEECWFIRGWKFGPYYLGWLDWHSKGTVASVDFDWEKAMKGNILGFYHSHPLGMTSPSTRDDRTMGAWVRAEGRSLLCGIFSGKDQACYRYDREGPVAIRARVMNGAFFGKDV